MAWLDEVNSKDGKLRAEKASATKAYNAKRIGEVIYDNRVNAVNLKRNQLQTEYLHKIRKIDGLPTERTR